MNSGRFSQHSTDNRLDSPVDSLRIFTYLPHCSRVNLIARRSGKAMKIRLLKNLALAAVLSVGLAAAKAPANVNYTDPELAAKVAHEVRMYSRYSIWDNVNV